MENKDTVIGNNFDIIDVAKSIEKEKGITSEEVLEAMETAIEKAGRTKYGHELDIRAHVNRDNGYIGLFRYQEVVKDLEELPSDERINLTKALATSGFLPFFKRAIFAGRKTVASE